MRFPSTTRSLSAIARRTNATTEFSAEMVQNQETNANRDRLLSAAIPERNECRRSTNRLVRKSPASMPVLVKQSVVTSAEQLRHDPESSRTIKLELGANKQIYVTQVDAAGQIRSAGLEAAKTAPSCSRDRRSWARDFERSRTRYAHSVLKVDQRNDTTDGD